MLTITDNEVLIRNSVFGLLLYGKVDAVPGANQIRIRSLAGFGAGRFNGATNPYWVMVIRKATGTGAAPQGELQPITAYATATGTFTTNAFTVPIAVNDEILVINPALAAALASTNEAYGETFGPLNVQVGNVVTHGVTIFDPGGGIVPAASITGGNYTIDRIRGVVSVNIVPATPSLVMNGAVYESYNFPGASWAIGDIFVITFTGIQVTLGPIVTSFPDMRIYGRVVMEPTILTAVKDVSVPVNITAILGGETDVLIYNGVATGTAYNIDNLRIKSADPGAGNRVRVRLYQLINNVLTQVNEFVITSLNFNNYFSLVDMFGLPMLSDYNVQVTVRQEVAGGPTAVTGQYTYRFA